MFYLSDEVSKNKVCGKGEKYKNETEKKGEMNNQTAAMNEDIKDTLHKSESPCDPPQWASGRCPDLSRSPAPCCPRRRRPACPPSAQTRGSCTTPRGALLWCSSPSLLLLCPVFFLITAVCWVLFLFWCGYAASSSDEGDHHHARRGRKKHRSETTPFLGFLIFIFLYFYLFIFCCCYHLRHIFYELSLLVLLTENLITKTNAQ